MSLARAVRKVAQETFVPAPMGGLNTADPIAQMAVTDAVSIQNLIPAEFGLRARLGSIEWVTGLDSGASVLTVLPFNGPVANGTNDRLFVTTSKGIWDCSASTTTPTKVFSFPVTTGSAGVGVCSAMVTSAGHFLAYCDEANGYLLYVDSTGTWQQVQDIDNAVAWTGSHAYTAGAYVKNGSNVYLCTQSGTSASSGGPTGTGTAISDGSCTWNFNFSITGADPSTFVHVLAWKNRLWFTQTATAVAWFLGTNAIGGTASEFVLGGQFRAGGPLVGLWNWTVDGGAGVDDFLVALSGAGDVVIYQGTDPTSATLFGLKGVWSVGALPKGRRIATEFGGDILIASMVGLVPLTKIVQGNVTFDRSQYLTAKVQNLFNYYTGLYGMNSGWQLVLDPKDNALLVLVPITAGSPSTQLAMSLATRGWFPYAGLAMNCAAPWNGTLYFGTTDGRLVKHDGYVDGVTLANPNTFNAIQWNVVHAFQNLGTPLQKRIGLLRPMMLSQGGAVPLAAQARWDFDLSVPASLSGSTPTTGGWDSGLWDAAIWSGDFSTTKRVFGATGTGTYAAPAVEGLASSRTIYTGTDVTVETGGFL